MGCFSTSKRARIVARINTTTTQIEELETVYLEAIKNAEVEEYKFNSGEGSQQTKRRSPKQIREEIEALESSLDRLYAQLSGAGLVNMNLRRRRYNNNPGSTRYY